METQSSVILFNSADWLEKNILTPCYFHFKNFVKNILTLLCKVKSITQNRQSFNAAVMIIYYLLTTVFKMDYCWYEIR